MVLQDLQGQDSEMILPLAIVKKRYNRTLHGRSVYRKMSVPGHNVFMGYNARNGDGLDIFCEAGTEVRAMHDGVIVELEYTGRNGRVQIKDSNDTRSMYAHIHVKPTLKIGSLIKAGQVIGYVGRVLRDPHLHLELWVEGKAISGKTPTFLADRIIYFCD